MVIAVDIRGAEAYQQFIYEVFKRITVQHPDHTFIFISDNEFDPSFIFSENVIAEVVKQTKISLLSDHKVSSLLKKHKADVLVTTKYISQTKVPQCLMAMDNVTPTSLKKAKVIVTDSQFSQKEIVGKYKIEESKVDVVYKGVDEIFKPVSFEQKEKIKEIYAGGNEYFLFLGQVNSPNNLLNLLKAFSVFKKMQKSNMQLLISLKKEMDKGFLEKMKLFKYKNEVKVLENVTGKESATITAAAYAFVYPFANEYSYPLQAIKCNVPVIVFKGGVFPEILSDAALYIKPDDHKDIADKMMLIYKDEKLRQQLIEKGKEQVKKYSWDKTADSLWESIEKACT